VKNEALTFFKQRILLLQDVTALPDKWARNCEGPLLANCRLKISERNPMKLKVREWIKRYLPAEILSIITTLISAALAYKLTGNQITTALAGTWGGNISYFGYILLSDVIQTVKTCRVVEAPYTGKTFLKNLRALALEFGVAEVTDSFFIRPMLMYYLPILVDNLSLGILLAKFAADVTFYVPAIVSYELSKKYLKKSR
jgi:hypothetical protein